MTSVRKFFQLIGLLVALGVLAAGLVVPYVGGAGLGAKAAADKFLDTNCTLTEEPVEQKTTLLASDGKTVIATLFDQNRSVVALKQVPKSVINALISTEDRRFYDHHGVDIRGLARGALKTSGGDKQGASTLTEQYVKQVRYYQADTQAEEDAAVAQNIDRKISDAKCALDLEKKYDKNTILEKYLNIAFFGQNAYGIQTAAQTFFNTDVSKLTVPQAALLVGLVKNPTQLNPYDNGAAAKARRDLVLTNMADQNYITAAQAAAYKNTRVILQSRALPKRGCAYANAAIRNVGYFCDYAVSWLENTGGLTAKKINTGGLTITTTIDANLQNSGQQAIWTQSGLDPAHSGGYILAMPSVNPKNGAVTSMITDLHYGTKPGDAGYSVGRIFTDAYAGSGSTYKYFTALTALKAGVDPNFTLSTSDPYHTKNCPENSNPYRNAGPYPGTMPLRTALPESSNNYFVGMEDQLFGCNLTPIANTAVGLGLNALTSKAYPDTQGRTMYQQVVQDQAATFTLGQRNTSALELAGAFSALGNDGVFCPPTPISSVTDPTGKAVPFKKIGCSRQFDPYIAHTLQKIMVNDTNPSGTGGTAASYFGDWYGNGGSLVVGKTGTNNSYDGNGDTGGNSALWFVGVTPTLTSAAALVNPAKPGQKISEVPGVTANSDGGDTFGAAASKFWLQAYGPSLQSQKWTWTDPDATPGSQVQVSLGQSVEQVSAQLANQGFKATVYSGVKCGSRQPIDTVAYFSPKIALPGATITLCQSSGVAPIAYYPPVKKPTKPGTPPSTGPTLPGGGITIPNPRPTHR